MNLPPNLQYFVIGSNDRNIIDFYNAIDVICEKFSIKIGIRQISFEPFLELLKVEKNYDYVVFLSTSSVVFRSKALTTLNGCFSKSRCNHRLAVIDEDLGYEMYRRQIYCNLLGSLNLVYLFTRDNYLKTHGIQISERSPLKSSIVSTSIDPIPVEIANLQPIILDQSKCGVLRPVLYFSGRDFGTCIGQILLPGSLSWSMAYFIELHDSDMVKVCLVKQESSQSTIIATEPTSVSTNDHKDDTVLYNMEYPFCCELTSNLKDTSSVKPLIKNIKHLIGFCERNAMSLFPDLSDPFEVKKKYAKLCKEVDLALKAVTDHRMNDLKDSHKSVRKMINILCFYLKRNVSDENYRVDDSKKYSSHWIDDAKKYASHSSRNSNETIKIKRIRLDTEEKDGIVTMPLLEPYLDLKWPSKVSHSPSDPQIHPVVNEYIKFLKLKEEKLLSSKRFGI